MIKSQSLMYCEFQMREWPLTSVIEIVVTCESLLPNKFPSSHWSDHGHRLLCAVVALQPNSTTPSHVQYHRLDTC